MAGYPWKMLLADCGCVNLEPLVVTLLIAQHPNALKQNVGAKAELAGTLEEMSDSISTLEAIEHREAVLDGHQNLAIDYYSIRRLVLPAPYRANCLRLR